MPNKSFPVRGNLGYGPDIEVSVGDVTLNPDNEDIILEVGVGGETNGAASVSIRLNYLGDMGVVDSLIKALQDAKAESIRRCDNA